MTLLRAAPRLAQRLGAVAFDLALFRRLGAYMARRDYQRGYRAGLRVAALALAAGFVAGWALRR